MLMKTSTLALEVLPNLESGWRSLVATVEAGGITIIADLEFPMMDEEIELHMANTVLQAEKGGPRFTTFAVPSSRMYLLKSGSHSKAMKDIQAVSAKVIYT